MRIYVGMNALGKKRIGFVLQSEPKLPYRAATNGVETGLKEGDWRHKRTQFAPHRGAAVRGTVWLRSGAAGMDDRHAPAARPMEGSRRYNFQTNAQPKIGFDALRRLH